MKEQLSIVLPSERTETILEVFYLPGELAMIVGANGKACIEMLQEIEKDFADNPDDGFDHGAGHYLFVPKWESPQIGDEGRVELPGYWDLRLVGFKAVQIEESGL